MRLFTAIDIPPDVKAALAGLLDRLRPLAKLNRVPIEKLHITTKFIGEWPEEKLDQLKRALDSVKAPAPVEIVIRGLGRLPRVLYAGVEPNDALTALAVADAEIRRQSLVCIGSFRASSFALYLSAAGKYTKLQEFPFTHS